MNEGKVRTVFAELGGEFCLVFFSFFKSKTSGECIYLKKTRLISMFCLNFNDWGDSDEGV